MESLIAIIIWAAVIFFIIVRIKAGNKKTKKRTTTIETVVREAAAKGAAAVAPHKVAERAAVKLMSSAPASPAAAVKPAAYRKGTLSAAGIHDDRNDWLSQQLAEEKRSERLMSAMFGLKLEHALDCPAEKIRDEHAANCDAEEVKRYSRK